MIIGKQYNTNNTQHGKKTWLLLGILKSYLLFQKNCLLTWWKVSYARNKKCWSLNLVFVPID